MIQHGVRPGSAQFVILAFELCCNKKEMYDKLAQSDAPFLPIVPEALGCAC